MMRVKGIILCEGETDLVLISSYLGKVRGWEHFRYKESPFPSERVEWYRRNDEEVLGIWQVGGSSFAASMGKILLREQREHVVESVVMVTDHDDSSAENGRLDEALSAVRDVLGSPHVLQGARPNQWHNITVAGDFVEADIRLGYLLVPINEYGALETFMLDALSENSVEKEQVVAQSKSFVKNFKSDVYLKKRREQTKAELGVALAVFSPDKVFTTMKELIDLVDWSSFEATDKQFKLLTEI